MSRAMKDSGIPWIGEIPKEWNVSLIASCIKEVDCKNTDGKEDNALQFKMGTIISKRNGDSKYNPETLEAYNIVKVGDIIINGLNLSFDLISQRVGLVKENGVITSTYIAVRPTINISNEFLTYLFKAYDNCKAFHSMGRGLRQTLSYGELRKYYVVLPLKEEQQRIAEFLDRKCVEIDEAIALQEEFIEELKSYKQSVITEAVTRGLNPNVKLKDSGIVWISMIPQGWKCEKVKHIISSISSGVSVNSEQIPATDKELGVLKTSSVSSNYFIPTENKRVDVEEMGRVSCPVKADTIIVSRMNTPDLVGSAGYCDDNIPNLYLPDRLWQVETIKDRVSARYLWRFLISLSARYYYSSLSQGTSSSMQNISQSQFESAYVPVPPLTEQHQIANYLDEKCAEIDSLIAIKQQKIEELKEYKKSIIYEYVTGKKEVDG